MSLIEVLDSCVVPGQVTLASGQVSAYKIDLDRARHRSASILHVLDGVARIMSPHRSAVAGEGGAWKWAELYGKEFGLPAYEIGKEGRMLDKPDIDTHTLVIEDVLTTGASVARAARAVLQAGSYPYIAAVVQRDAEPDPEFTHLRTHVKVPYGFAVHENQLPTIRAIKGIPPLEDVA